MVSNSGMGFGAFSNLRKFVYDDSNMAYKTWRRRIVIWQPLCMLDVCSIPGRDTCALKKWVPVRAEMVYVCDKL